MKESITLSGTRLHRAVAPPRVHQQHISFEGVTTARSLTLNADQFTEQRPITLKITSAEV